MILNYKVLFILFFFNGMYHALCARTKPYRICVEIKRDSVFASKTATIEGKKYTAVINEHGERFNFYIKNQKGQIVYVRNEGEAVADFNFVDFNGDGYKDIILDLLVADSGMQELLLYDSKVKKFVFAGNCPNAEKIQNTKYFYSYQDCCAGQNWDSDLFYIYDLKIIYVGHITYRDGKGLWFYKFSNKKKRLIKRWMVRINGDTPVTTGPHIDFDLPHYWTKHLHTFVK